MAQLHYHSQQQASQQTLRQLLQSRSQHAPLSASRDSTYSALSSSTGTGGGQEDTPSLYSRGEFSPPLHSQPAFVSQAQYRPSGQYRPMPNSGKGARPDTATTVDSVSAVSLSSTTSAPYASADDRSARSVYSPSHALDQLLPTAGGPECVVRRERVDLSPVAERTAGRQRGHAIARSGSGWFEEETETEEEYEEGEELEGDDEDELDEADLDGESFRSAAGGAGFRGMTATAEKVHLQPSTPIAVTFPTTSLPNPSPAGPSTLVPLRPSPSPLKKEKHLPPSPPRPSPTRSRLPPPSPQLDLPQAPPSPPPHPALNSPNVSQASPNLASSATSAPLTSHLSFSGPKMTFLSPAPWEEDDLSPSSLSGAGSSDTARASFSAEERARSRKMSDDRGSAAGAGGGGGRKFKPFAGMGRAPAQSRESDRSELKGLGLISPHSNAGKGGGPQTASSGSSQSGGSGGSAGLGLPGGAAAAGGTGAGGGARQGRGKSRSRPNSPSGPSSSTFPGGAQALSSGATSASGSGGAGAAGGAGKRGVAHKFSLPRLRHAFQAQSSQPTPHPQQPALPTTAATGVPFPPLPPPPAPPAAGGKQGPAPSPSTASFTSSLPSPSPLETDFPKTPTSLSQGSLSLSMSGGLHPLSAGQSPARGAKLSMDQAHLHSQMHGQGQAQRGRSVEEKRSATMPEQGGVGISLISLEQARANAVQQPPPHQQPSTAHRQQSLPTPRLGSTDNLSSTALPAGQAPPPAQQQAKAQEKVLKGKRSFLRLFNSPNIPAGFARESKELPRGANGEELPPVPALPAAYLALPSPAMTASSHSSPNNSPPQPAPGSNLTSSAGQSLRERRQAARPSPPLEVNVLISRATNSDPSVAATAADSLPVPPRMGPLASAPPGQSQFLSHSASTTLGGLEVPKTPRTPAPQPLTLRPVSTAFSAGFANLLGEQLQAGAGVGSSPPKLRQVQEEEDFSPISVSIPAQRFPKSAPASTTTSPVLYSPARSSASAAAHAHRRERTRSQSAEEVIAQLQAQIASTKRLYARRVEELEGEVEGLRREVGRLEGLVRNESHVCDRCGGKL